jgi:hypothetical protein
MRHALIVTFALTLMASVGCKKRDPLGCKSNDACPSGYVCGTNSACTKICSADADCPTGFICEYELCQSGARQNPPEIDTLTSNGTSTCSGSATVNGAAHDINENCIGTQLLVSGENLDGGDWWMIHETESENNIHLTLNETSSTDVLAVLDFPGTLSVLEGGIYLLSVSNENGTDTLNMTVLKGDPGADGEDGVAGATGTAGTSCTVADDTSTEGNALITCGATTSSISAGASGTSCSVEQSGDDATITCGEASAIISGGSGSSATLSVYTSTGTTAAYEPTSSDAVTEAIELDRAHFSLGASNAGSAYIKIPESIMNDYCQDADGCSLTMGAKKWPIEGTDPLELFPATHSAYPCQFYMDDARGWMTSNACNKYMETFFYYEDPADTFHTCNTHADCEAKAKGLFCTYDVSGTDTHYCAYSLAWAPFGSGMSGTDGNTSENATVLNYYKACYLSESKPCSSTVDCPTTHNSACSNGLCENGDGDQVLPNDADNAFYFIMANSAWGGYDADDRGWTEGSRTCELTIKD